MMSYFSLDLARCLLREKTDFADKDGTFLQFFKTLNLFLLDDFISTPVVYFIDF